MEAVRVGSRGHLFRFDDPYETYVYAIVAEKRVYLCDTYVGPEPMATVRQYLNTIDSRTRDVVVFNSHADYDHFWGNCLFKEAMVIGHDECRRRIIEEGSKSLDEHAADMRGEVTIVPPQVTFMDRLDYPNDGVLFYHTPGHTADSSSCLDKVDGVLFVGDNMEYPIPYVNDLHFDGFISTLREYLRLDWNAIVTGHSGIHTDRTLLNQNIRYLESFSSWCVDPEDLAQHALQVHVTNLVTLCRHLADLRLDSAVFRHYHTVIDALNHSDKAYDYGRIIELFERFLSRAQ